MPNKQQILKSLVQVAKKIGRAPSRAEFLSRSGFSLRSVLQWFPTWNAAIRSAGLRTYALNVRLDDAVLLENWARVVRKHRAIPPRRVYLLDGKYDPGTLAKRFGGYSSVPQAFRKFAAGKRQWADVLALLPAPVAGDGPTKGTRTRPANTFFPAIFSSKSWPAEQPGQPIYGNPTSLPGFLHEPLNELGVVLLFGMLAKDLGFVIEAIHKEFPDCEAKRQVGPGRWQRVRIEFEFESKNYREHGHPLTGCDLLICWRHNWPNHPSHLEILELSGVINSLPNSRT
jgi:Homing endonuclease associated repeat